MAARSRAALKKHRNFGNKRTAMRQAKRSENKIGRAVMPLPIEDAAWLAGIVDGEGCLTSSKGFDRRDGVTRYQFRLVISNCDTDILDRTQKIFEALRIRFYKLASKRAPNERPLFTLTVASIKSLTRILPEILNYLTGRKKLLAEMMLAYCEGRLNKPEHSNYTEAEIITQYFIRSVMACLNRRGVPITEEGGWEL